MLRTTQDQTGFKEKAASVFVFEKGLWRVFRISRQICFPKYGQTRDCAEKVGIRISQFIELSLLATCPGRKSDQTEPCRFPSKLRSPAPKPGTGIQENCSISIVVNYVLRIISRPSRSKIQIKYPSVIKPGNSDSSEVQDPKDGCFPVKERKRRIFIQHTQGNSEYNHSRISRLFG